jgi:hypothetical protein
MGFEPTIPVFELGKTFHASDRAATVIGSRSNIQEISKNFMESNGPVLRSEEPSRGSYPEPDKSNPYHPILFLLDPF